MALRRLLHWLGFLREPAPRNFELDIALHPMLDTLAQQQQRTPDELASTLVASALARQAQQGELWDKWESLSPRQQQVMALICLGYTNGQIAVRLGIAISTVHTYSRKIQLVFEVNSKLELRRKMDGWDFRAWEK